MNRRLAACCAVLVLLAAACAESVRGSAAGVSTSAVAPTVVGSAGSSSEEGLTSAAPSSPIEVSAESIGVEPSEPGTSESEPTRSSETGTSEATGSSETGESEQPAITGDVDWQLPDPKPDPPRNSFGDIAAEPGQSYGVTVGASDDAPPALVFRVRKLVVDPTCADGSTTPRNGHFLLLDLQVEPRGFGDEQADSWYGTFTSYGWVAFDSEGGAQTAIDTDEAGECLPDKGFPSLNKDELADADGLISGVVVLDVADPTGTVLLDLGTDDKWEFGYPG